MRPPRRRSLWSPRDTLEFGRHHYRAVFSQAGPSAAYVLADLRSYARARPEQIDAEVLEREVRENPAEFAEHMARVRFYRRIRRFLDVTDAEIDAAEEDIAEMQGGVNG